jgi:recombination protein RecR
VLDRTKTALVHDDDAHRRRGGHGRSAAVRLEHPDLAEEVAGPQIVDVLAVAVHLGGPVLDHEELVRERPFDGQRLPGCDVQLVRVAGDRGQLLVVEAVEEPETSEFLCVHARILAADARRHNGGVLSPAVENLVAQLSRLPGVGQRTAQRLAFHLLQRSKEEALALASAIEDVKERVRFCRECGNLTEEELCAICTDTRRDHALVCVVEQPVDVISLERTHEFRGLYHVLGGALSPLDGVEPGDLRIDELLRRVEANGVQEVVLATNPNMTGEATAAFLADRLRGRVRVTRLASGLPVGGDLEYADEVTLGRALSGRREM